MSNNTLKALMADRQFLFLRGALTTSDGRVAIALKWDDGYYANYFSTGYFQTLRGAIEYLKLVLESEDEMNIYKTNLFRSIKGVMLKEKRITLHLSGKVAIVALKDDARIELWFMDHDKSAVINANQASNIAEVYGPETDAWKGRPIVLYGEEGEWFGRHTWGIRVDLEATKVAAKAASKAQAEKPAARKRITRPAPNTPAEPEAPPYPVDADPSANGAPLSPDEMELAATLFPDMDLTEAIH